MYEGTKDDVRRTNVRCTKDKCTMYEGTKDDVEGTKDDVETMYDT